MPILRRDKRPDGYYILDRKVAEDSRLSWEARGLLTYLLVKPDHWEISVADLIRKGTAGRDKVYAILAELRKVGYIQKTQDRVVGQFKKHYYLISEAPPFPENPEMVEPLPASPDTALPEAAKPTLVNNQDPARTQRPATHAAKRRCATADASFKELQAEYPKRSGAQRWGDALKHYHARLKEGYTHEQMLEGVRRYKAYCVTKQITGRETVQQAATFLGTNRCFLEDWYLPPTQAPGPVVTAEQQQKREAANAAAKASWYRVAERLGLNRDAKESEEEFLSRVAHEQRLDEYRNKPGGQRDGSRVRLHDTQGKRTSTPDDDARVEAGDTAVH